MTSALDDSIRSALAAIVAESPDLGTIATDHYAQLRQSFEQPRHPRRRSTLIAAALCVTAALGAIALVRRNPADEPVAPQAPAVSTSSPRPPASDSASSVSIGYLAVPTMDGGAFVFDGHEPRMGVAMHDPATALPQHTTSDVSVIYVGREQFGPLEQLTTGTEIDWVPIGGPAEIVFTVTSVLSYGVDTNPATTSTTGLIIVIDTADSSSGQRVVITAIQAMSPTTTVTTAG